MHGTAQKPTAYDRRSVMTRAWGLWRLAQDVANRGPHDHFGIMAQVKAAGGLRDAQIAAVNADYDDRRRVKGVSSFGDAVRVAWAGERQRVENVREDIARELRYAEIASRPAREFIGREADAFSALMADSFETTKRELARLGMTYADALALV